MNTNNKRSGERSHKLIWIGLGLGALFWILEAFIHVLIFKHGSLFVETFFPEAHEIWMRSLVVGLFILFGIYAQFIINQRKQIEKSLLTL